MQNLHVSFEPTALDFGRFEIENIPFDTTRWLILFRKLSDLYNTGEITGSRIPRNSEYSAFVAVCFDDFRERAQEHYEATFPPPVNDELYSAILLHYEQLEISFSQALVESIRSCVLSSGRYVDHDILQWVIEFVEDELQLLIEQCADTTYNIKFPYLADCVVPSSDNQHFQHNTISLESQSTQKASSLSLHSSTRNNAAKTASRSLRVGERSHLWTHLTISRDQTSASDLRRELLSILDPSTGNSAFDHQKLSPGFESPHSEPDVSLASTELPDQAHQQAQQTARQTGSIPDYQRRMSEQEFRLDRIRKTMASHDAAEIETSLANLSVDFSSKTVYHQSASRADEGHQGIKPANAFQASLPGATEPAIYTELMSRITSLEAENKKLKTFNETATQIQNLYWIMGRASNKAYLSEPTLSIGPGGQVELTANFPIADITSFLSSKSHSIAFAVFQYYTHEDQEKEVKAAIQANQPLPRPKHYTEAILLNSQEMIDAAEAFFATEPKFAEEFPGLDIRAPLPAPYLFWYYYRTSNIFSRLSTHHQQQMQLLTSWIDANYGAIYDLVDQQLAEGVISSKSMPFLIKPEDVLVWEAKGELHAVVAKSWPVQNAVAAMQALDPMEDIGWAREHGPAFRSVFSTWEVHGWRYAYDGRLLRKDRSVQIVLKSKCPDDKIPIQDLSAYPLRFAKPRVVAILEKRGHTFWRCREQKFVSYDDEKDVNEAGERYMVDFETYKQLHSDSENFQKMYPHFDDPTYQCIRHAEMAANDPPPAPQIYVFPSTIPGYNMRSKKWIDLKVDCIKDVTWNKQSFEHLVVDSVTKELVQAVVMHQIASEKGTDIIERKGNGLVILLHGGPGTGKTFTAESVAELAEKPLFRVTCGDIGTQPEKVEKYLESALYLGKVWGCVVLIDEAEVFLEQRSLDNLERNALVSVFLRVLEYYEGILILTSNRVGTFDEAFKSRILLSLHYDNLTTSQRTKIWKNFFSRLKTMDLGGSSKTNASASTSSRELGDLGGSKKPKFEDVETEIDFDDVECYLGELAAFELNGRQIRNVITAARQYANFKGVAMNHEHLKHVIEVSSKFEKYLKTVQEGFSGDEIMRGDGIR